MDYERTRAVADELTRHAPDAVRGYEISGDAIILKMSASRPHEFIALRIRQQLDRQLDPSLVDPRKSTLAVFSDPGPGPEGPRYRAQHDYAFGDEITVGPWTLATTDLRPYPAGAARANPVAGRPSLRVARRHDQAWADRAAGPAQW